MFPWTKYLPLLISLFRLEPPSGQLSSVTQVRSQKRKSKTPLSSADPAGCIEMDEEEGNTKRSAVEDLRDKERLKEADCGEDKREGQEMEEMELGDSTRSKDADDSFKAETFAGVGEFVATAAKDEKTDLLQTPRLRDLDMRCVEEAALRYINSWSWDVCNTCITKRSFLGIYII